MGQHLHKAKKKKNFLKMIEKNRRKKIEKIIEKNEKLILLT
jgi:hypothetical protein